MNGNRWSAWLPDLLALLIILLTFSNVGFRNLEQPGLYEDEAWDAIHAVKLAAQSHRSFPPGMSDLASVGRDYTLVSENVRDLLGGLYMPNFLVFGPPEGS